MPRYVTSTGTNSSGNTYRNYSDGAYSYHNTHSDGSTGNYYQAASGGAFYSNNKGYSSYTPANGSGGWSQQK